MQTITTAQFSPLAELLTACGSQWAPLARGEAQWEDNQNEAMADLIKSFADCPEALKGFDRSDWVNLCECYTYKLIERYENQTESIKSLFNEYCEAIGATNALEALEGQNIEDPEDMMAAMVNLAMSYGAQLLISDLWPDR